jgi:hypothetical protein
MDSLIIDEKTNEVRLNMDTRFYLQEAILEALKDFSDNHWVYADKSLDDYNLLVVIKPKSDTSELNNLGYEFYNYVLGLMQNG